MSSCWAVGVSVCARVYVSFFVLETKNRFRILTVADIMDGLNVFLNAHLCTQPLLIVLMKHIKLQSGSQASLV